MTSTIIVWKLDPIIKQLDEIDLRFLYHEIQIMLQYLKKRINIANFASTTGKVHIFQVNAVISNRLI